jgi:molybdopterin/thiamine biosynthesis adenylyltransferase
MGTTKVKALDPKAEVAKVKSMMVRVSPTVVCPAFYQAFSIETLRATDPKADLVLSTKI